jgi:hypothetical protein
MKVECPICGVQGFLEVRGNSQRVVHYKYVDGQRVFTKHTVKGTDGNNGNSMGTEKPNTAFFNQNDRGCRLAWSRLRDLGSRDPGSNPGSPTNYCS